MQTQNIVKSYVAASTIAEFDLVKFDANGKIAQCGAADATSALILGIAQRGCAAGEVTDVLIHGVSRVKLGAIAAFENSGDCLLTAAANGTLDSAASTNFVVARILPNINSTASAANDQGEVLFFGPVIVKA
tara:strand:- start:2628 stop:3023 length:396 start_codon:yes stop_codon:yes gene_type:complete